MIILTDTGVATVWDGARLVLEKDMTLHELAALQVSVALAIRRRVAMPTVPHDRRSPMEHERDV